MSKTIVILFGDDANRGDIGKEYATLDVAVLMPVHFYKDVFDVKQYSKVTIMLCGDYSLEKLKILITHCFENNIKSINVNNEVIFRPDNVESIPVIGINSAWIWGNNDLEKQALDKCLSYTNNIFDLLNCTDFKSKHEMTKAIIQHREKYFNGGNNG